MGSIATAPRSQDAHIKTAVIRLIGSVQLSHSSGDLSACDRSACLARGHNPAEDQRNKPQVSLKFGYAGLNRRQALRRCFRHFFCLTCQSVATLHFVCDAPELVGLCLLREREVEKEVQQIHGKTFCFSA
jgi:hypothetical protein